MLRSESELAEQMRRDAHRKEPRFRADVIKASDAVLERASKWALIVLAESALGGLSDTAKDTE
jgi:hypothetical protein